MMWRLLAVAPCCCSYRTPEQGHQAAASQRWLRGVNALALVVIAVAQASARNAAADNLDKRDITKSPCESGETGMARLGSWRRLVSSCPFVSASRKRVRAASNLPARSVI